MRTKGDILRGVFGFDGFRPGQEDIIDATLSGRDVLAVMPTGGGKSLCYQIPALLTRGATFVISPLVSLMKDQVGALRQNGVAAAFLNSTLTPGQYRKALDNAASGMYRIIYIAPERLSSPDFRAFAAARPPERIAVDEAHCVSQWGRDFRPSYLDIGPFVESLPFRPTLAAFTATATNRVRTDIVELLGLRDPVRAVGAFDRPNLFFEVIKGKGGRARDRLLMALMDEQRGRSGIIYCATRKTVDSVCDMLRGGGIGAGRYHAGMPDDERRASQDAFASDDTPVLVATNAFGMGIDKSNVSFIIHYNMPGDLESYYQEAGRAGRDGSDALCLLLFAPADIMVRKSLIEHGEDARDPEALRRAKQRLEVMISYATGGGCLRARLLRYFGEKPPVRCGSCGNCAGPRIAESILAAAQAEPAVRAARVKPKREASSAVDAELFERLKELRLSVAKAQGIPAYMVFSNATLEDMCRKHPRTLAAMLNVAGVGEHKVRAYGARFLQVLLDQ
ncbi:MAG: ATP-dependent DNA helicase [Oscillospiraceae bacterium]|jgi:ATP-dependent DNA helicase RecQ|nr:ATP-dependent DNA helicase [Oscillospiraceae bacterium]